MNAHQAYQIQQERDRIVKVLAVTRAPCRAVTAVVRRLLLDAPHFYNGVRVSPKVRNLGAGVYEVTNET